MATTWTKDRGIGSYGSKIRTKVSLLSQDRGANTSRLRVEVSIYNGGRSSSNDSSVSMSISGTVSYATSGGIAVPGNSWREILDREFTVAHDSDGSKSFTINGNLGSTGTSTFGSGGTAEVSGSLPRLMLAPSSPVNLLASRVNDGAQRLTWGNRASSRAPYDRVQVQRRPRSTGRWEWVTTSIGSSAQSYQDSGTKANDRYDYQVRAVNSQGVSSWSRNGDGTSDVSTTPAAPTGVTAKKSGSAIRVSWTDRADNVYHPRTFLVEDSPGGGAWVQVGTIGGSAESWTHSSPDPSKTHRYRVRARISERGNTLTSGYSAASDTVQLQAAPKAPTLREPRDGAVLDAGGTIGVRWTHNPVDTTDQEAYEVRYRTDGGDWTVLALEAGSEGDLLDVQPGLVGRAAVEWQVRTRGAHPGFGPWSPVARFVSSRPPWAAVQTPEQGSVLGTSRLTVTWQYDPVGSAPELAQAGWRVTLLDGDGGTLEVAAGEGSAESAELQSRLVNDAAYSVVVEARNGDGLWSYPDVGTAAFTTVFPVPTMVGTVAEWSRDAATVGLGFTVEEETATYAWTGTPRASSSTRTTAEGTVTNLVTNPVGPGATDTSGWVSWGDPITFETVDGEPALYVEESAGSISTYTDPDYRPAPPVGSVIRVTGDVMVTRPTPGMRIRVVNYGGAGTTVLSDTSRAQVPEDGWVRHETVAVVTAMPDGAYTRTLFWPDAIPAGQGFYVRRVLVTVDGPAEAPYFDGDTPAVTEADAVDVERDDGDGWTLIASGIDTATRITDRTPRIGDVRYRAVSRTVLPTERTGPESVAVWEHRHDPVYVSGGTGWAVTCTARGTDATDKHTVEQGVRRFAGSPLPVAFFGEARDYVTTFTGRILRHPVHPVSTRTEWTDLLLEAGLVCFRDCRGRKAFGLLDVAFTTGATGESVAITVQQARHTEGVPRVSDVELEARITEQEG